MKLLEYLTTRIGFIAAHLLAGVMCIAVIQLDLLRTGGDGLTRGSSVISLCYSVLLIMALAVDYLKQKPLSAYMGDAIRDPLQWCASSRRANSRAAPCR